MKKSKLRGRILMELENLISLSCKNVARSKKYEQLHIAILKKYYNATDVTIDYHRHRIEMDIVMDDTVYNPKRANTYLPTLHTNLLFNSLKNFLRSCIEQDDKSIGFYAQLLNTFTSKETHYSLV